MKMKVDMRSDKRKGKKFKTESASALQLKPYGKMQMQQEEKYKWK